MTARRLAVETLHWVLHRNRPLDEAFDHLTEEVPFKDLDPRDRAFAYRLIAMALRRRGQIEAMLANFITRSLPPQAAMIHCVLLAGAAQLLFLETPAHATIDLAVNLAKSLQGGQHLAGLVNAVLRKVAAQGPPLLAAQDEQRVNVPDWLWTRWTACYGEPTVRAMAAQHLKEPPLDLTVRSDPASWADRLGGIVLSTGSVRLQAKGRIDALEGYAAGQWWVQDAAAALPARLFGDVGGKCIADLCAAPGGKTAQLAAMGAAVVAVDSSAHRLERLRQNLTRLSLNAEIVRADIAQWEPTQRFDGILLDAPCLATGTVRRHPDIPHVKTMDDLAALTGLQARLIDRTVTLLKPGARLIYCTCSLEPEEGQAQIEAALARHPELAIEPIGLGELGELGAAPDWITPEGLLRTLPSHVPHADPACSGIDGFFAARLRRLK